MSGNAECGMRNAELDAGALRRIGWTVLMEWFGAWRQTYLTREQLVIYGGAEHLPLLKTDWLRRTENHSERYVPAGELEARLKRLHGGESEEAEALLTPLPGPLHSSGEGGDAAADFAIPSPPLHVATVPFPHLTPAPSETAPAREAGLETSNSSNGAAGADAAPLSRVGTGSTPSLIPPEKSTGAEPSGRWDANPVQAPCTGGAAGDLARMIGALRQASDETRLRWLNLAQTQELNGWRDFAEVQQGTAHLRRLASDLFNALADCEYRLEIARMTLRNAKGQRA